MGRLLFCSLFTAVVLFLPLSTEVYSDTFTDKFDDPNFTSNNWMDYDTGVQKTWSFPLIGPANSGYHVSTTSSSPPAAKSANNGIEYYSTDLYIEALVRIDSHSSAYSSENIAGLAFSMTQGTGYFAAFELDFEGYNETVLQIGIIEGDRIVETPVNINFDTFYKLAVNVDANQNMHAYLYKLDGTLLGNVSAANVLSIDRGAVGIFGGLEVTFDDYTLTGNPVDQASPLSQTQISQLYVAIFGRASEGEGNHYWQTLELDMATTADVMLDTDAARNYFGANLNTNQAFIEHIYLNTLNKTIADDFDGISYWVNMLDTGTSRGQAVATLVGAINDYAPEGPHYDPDDAATVAAYNQFTNRVEVCDYMADNVYATPDDWETSTSFSHGLVVTDDPTTVFTAMDFINTITPDTNGMPADVYEEIKSSIEARYPYDFYMQKILIESQVEAYEFLESYFPVGVPSDVYEEIKSSIESRYPYDFYMQKILIESQVEAYEFLESYSPVGVPLDVYEGIKSPIEDRYPYDFYMQKILIESQVEAYLDLNS